VQSCACHGDARWTCTKVALLRCAMGLESAQWLSACLGYNEKLQQGWRVFKGYRYLFYFFSYKCYNKKTAELQSVFLESKNIFFQKTTAKKLFFEKPRKTFFRNWFS
jgi:hypothetical protein